MTITCVNSKAGFHLVRPCLLETNVSTFPSLTYSEFIPLWMQDSYNVSHEIERKRALNIILSQSRQQDREDVQVLLLLQPVQLYLGITLVQNMFRITVCPCSRNFHSMKPAPNFRFNLPSWLAWCLSPCCTYVARFLLLCGVL